MSAFAALCYLDGRPVEPATLMRMLAPLKRRGPHGDCISTDAEVGLGHSLLHTTPESVTEGQPLTQGGLTITADVRLDNRGELLAELGGDPVRGDAALILDAYRKWGTDCPSRLLGDFAFFVWDGNEQRGFGARDHLGARPFYYHRQPGKIFACASDPAAILAAPDVQRIVHESRIADYLVPILEGSDKTSTFYRDIFRLPPAHTLVITREQMRVSSYWQVDPTTKLHLRTDEEYTEAFREVFTSAVSSRLRSAGPVGIMLSGGLDSCAVAGVARAYDTSAVNLRTYSCLQRDPHGCPETEYVRAMLAGSPVAHQIRFDDELNGASSLLEEHLNTADDLFDFADIPLLVYGAAEQDGVQVMLDGVDGDVVAAANALYLIEYSRHSQVGRFLAGVPQYARYYGLTPLQQAALVWQQGIKPVIKERLPESWIARRRTWKHSGNELDRGDSLLHDSLISHEFADRIGLTEKLTTITGDTRWGQRAFRENDALTLGAPIIAAALERYDRLAASRSLEARHPFFDKRVVEFCLSLPLAIKQAGGWAKAVVRHATVGLVPDLIRWRRHSAANLNLHFFAEWIKPNAPAMADQVRSGLKEIAPYVNHAKLRDDLAGDPAVASQPESLWRIYQALRLLLWLRRN